MVQYDTLRSTLLFGDSKVIDGKLYQSEGFALSLKDVPENTRQLVVQVAKLIVSTANGNNPSTKSNEKDVSQLEKVKAAIGRLQTPTKGTVTEAKIPSGDKDEPPVKVG